MYEPRNLITESNCIAIGDSHTYGLGNKETDCWPYLLNAVNCGVPGVSIDYVARNCKDLLQHYKPEVVYLLKPHWGRFEIKEDDVYIQILPSDKQYEHLYRNESEEKLKQRHNRNLNKIKDLCKLHNALLVALDIEDVHSIIDYPDRWPIAPITAKNERPHYGPLWHSWIADLFKVRQSFMQYIKNETNFDVV